MTGTRTLFLFVSVLWLLAPSSHDVQASPTTKPTMIALGPKSVADAAAAPFSSTASSAPVTPPAGAPEPMLSVELASTNGQAWWQALIYDVVFKGIVPIFVPVLAALLFWLLRRLGIKIELETLDKLGQNAADYSEHKAKVWLRESGAKSSEAKKEDWAWEFVEAFDSKIKGRYKARRKLRGLILSKIAEAEKKASDASKGEREATGVVIVEPQT